MSWIGLLQEFRGGAAPWAMVGVTLGIAGSSRWLSGRLGETHKRGVIVAKAGRLGRVRARSDRLTLAGIAVPPPDEAKHFKMLGTTGTGKSTAIRELLGGALARGDRAVFADPDGGYCARFFSRYRGDVILNPFDRDSVRWDLFAEIETSYDVDELAAGLIPMTDDGSSNEWRGYARTFLTAVLRRCRRECPDCGELWRLLAVASCEELRAVVADTPAQPFLEAENARMFGSIRAVAMSAIATLEHITSQRATPFSIRRWVRMRRPLGEGPTGRAPRTAGAFGQDVPGALFITYRAGQIAALRSMIATWMRIAIFETMNGAEDRDQRLWFVIDELDALGAIEGLKDALARLRKFGGRCVIGFQSIAQVSGTYGFAGAQTIVENCSNTLILRCAGSENGGTSHFASKLIGEREVIRRQTTRGSDREGGFSARGARRSRNISEQHVTEAAVLPSQIEQLPDLCGYFKSVSSPAWRKVTLARPAGRY